MSGYASCTPISSDFVRTCRGDRRLVEMLRQQLAPFVSTWIERYCKATGSVDPAVVQERFDQTIQVDQVRRTPTLVRIVKKGKRTTLHDVLAFAQKAPNPAAALCWYVRQHVYGCCRDERKRVTRRECAWNGEEPRVDEPSFSIRDREHLLAALASLPEDEKIAIEMYYFEAIPQVEIGRRIGASRAGVHRILGRGRARLRSVLEAAD